MRCVILAAGYGTRFEKDLQSDSSGKFVHLTGIPKPLLPICGQALISHWVKLLHHYNDITEINVVINALHHQKFEEWLDSLHNVKSKIKLINEGSTSNELRPGAVTCMSLGSPLPHQDTIIIAGDTLFMDDFNLQDVINKYKAYKTKENTACLIISAPVSDDNVCKHGIIEVTSENLVVNFHEKPKLSETNSRLQSPCFYILSKDSLQHLQDYLSLMEEATLSKKDATGNFIQYLINKVSVYAYHLIGRYDVGGLQSYVQCNSNFTGFTLLPND